LENCKAGAEGAIDAARGLRQEMKKGRLRYEKEQEKSTELTTQLNECREEVTSTRFQLAEAKDKISRLDPGAICAGSIAT
jgi:septal ring factor EnvC (AmiA/AmiB activator)